MPQNGGPVREFKVERLAGLNLKDAADKVADNEFTQLQNSWQPTKGAYQPRWGSSVDVGSIPLCSQISGVWRHYAQNKQKFSVYHCLPDSTALPDNTSDLVFQSLDNGLGNIFNGGSVVILRICYSWIGRGMEQTYNSKNRSGFPNPSLPGSFPVDAWINSGHQQYTLNANTSQLKITVPSFPSGVTGANIFVARGTSTQMTFVGTVTTSGGSMVFGEFISPRCITNAVNISLAPISPTTTPSTSGGAVPDGNYTYLVTPLNQYGEALMTNLAGSTAVVSGGGGSGSVGLSWPAATGVTGYRVYRKTTGGSWSNSFITQIDTTATGTITMTDTNASGFPEAPPINLSNSDVVAYALSGSGNLTPGTYWIGVAYLTDTAVQEGLADPVSSVLGTIPVFYQQVTVSGNQNTIRVVFNQIFFGGNGAKALYVFIGTQNPTLHPMAFSGFLRMVASTTFDIMSIPTTNAQTSPGGVSADITLPFFNPVVNDGNTGGVGYAIGNTVDSRFGFLVSKDGDGNIKEIFPSRTQLFLMRAFMSTSVYAGDNAVNPNAQLHNFVPNIRTSNDKYLSTQPYAWSPKVYDPMFCYQLGISYFANGTDIPWMTDGYTLGQLTCYATTIQTQLPPVPRYIFAYQSGLIAAGYDNQVYGSNANAPQNWSTGGNGSALRFVTIGDAVGSGVSALGIFTPATEATGTSAVGSFMTSFKKNGTWMIPSIPDPTTVNGISGVGSPMVQVSGRVGCVAYRTPTNTPLGLMFLGQDANVYLINRVAEPTKVGTKVQNALIHLVGNDTAMAQCTAVYHDNHYKLSYPSPTATKNGAANDSELWADLRTENGDPITWNGPHVGRSIGAQVVLAGDTDDFSRIICYPGYPQSGKADDQSTLSDYVPSTGRTTPVVEQIQSKIYRFGEAMHLKRCLGAFIDAYYDSNSTNVVLLEFFMDSAYHACNRTLSTGGALWDSAVWDQGRFSDAIWGGNSFMIDDNNLVGRTLQWRLTHSNPSMFILSSMTLLLKREKRRIVA